MKVSDALKASGTFNFYNPSANAVKVAILPGVYSTIKGLVSDSKVVLSFADPTNLQNAGYQVDQVADDYNAADTVQVVQVTGSPRVSFRDFLNTVQRTGIKVSKITIQNKVSSQDIYDQEIEIARTAIGASGARDYIQLQKFVSVNAYDRTKIELDLSDETLDLGPETYMAITVPAGAKFSMQFDFEA